MNPFEEHQLLETRRKFFGRMATGIGTAALASLLGPDLARAATPAPAEALGSLGGTHFPPKAKRVIYLFLAEGPSQMDLFDHKPAMADWYDKDLPDSIRGNQRITTMTSGQERFPIAPSIYKFSQYGQQGTWISELLPHFGGILDDITLINTVHTEAINHDPAITFTVTGSQLPGRPSLGAWLSYGIGSENHDLPAFVVMQAKWSSKRDAQALYNRLWGTGFLPSRHQGVSLRSQGDPVLYLSNPPGVSDRARRKMLDGLAQLNQQQYEAAGDPEIQTRISQYEMAFRMQTSVPDLTDISDEPQHVLELYGPDVQKPGSFAASCLLARRMAERDVRFVQIFHRGWDQHHDLTGDLPRQCQDIDQPMAALIKDLKQRGMLEDTLVVCGTEFGRTIYCQGGLSKTNYGRDHHPRCFTMWMAGAGIKASYVHGKTDEFCYNIIENPVHVHDINATILERLGIDHERLTYRFQGRDFRLTDVHGNVVHDLIA